MKEFNNELKFIKKHQEEIIPVVQETGLVQEMGQQESAGRFLASDQKRAWRENFKKAFWPRFDENIKRAGMIGNCFFARI